ATLRRDNKNLRDVRQIVDEVIERNAVRIYVGDPINLKGKKTASTEDAHRFARQLSQALAEAELSTQVRLVDERLSTVSASQKLHQARVSSRNQRAVIDQPAAVAILEHALMLERNLGVNTGTLVPAQQEEDSDGQRSASPVFPATFQNAQRAARIRAGSCRRSSLYRKLVVYSGPHHCSSFRG